MHAALLLLAAITIRTDFEGGSASRIEKVTRLPFPDRRQRRDGPEQTQPAGQLVLLPRRRRGRRPVTLDMVDLPGEYNFKPNRGAITGDTPPVISYDGKRWTHVTDFEYDKEEARLRLRIKPERPAFWIATRHRTRTTGSPNCATPSGRAAASR